MERHLRPFGGETWKAAYLFSTCVFERNSLYDLPSIYDVDPLEVADRRSFGVTRYNVRGMFFGWMKVASDVVNRSSDFQEKVENYFIERNNYDDFFADRIAIRLKLDYANQLVSKGWHPSEYERVRQYNQEVNALYDEICPPWRDRIGHDSDWLRSHCLYFEPKEELKRDDLSVDEFLLSFRDAAEIYFGVEGTLELPVMLQDVLLLSAPGYGNHDKSCVAVRHGPLDGGDGWHLPLIPLQFADHLAVLNIKYRIGGKLRALDVGGSAYKNMYHSHRQFHQYAERFLDERAAAETWVRQAEEADMFLEETFPTKLIYSFSNEGVRLFEAKVPHFLNRHIHEIFRSDRQRADENLIESVSLVLGRLTRLTSYLRDAAAADLATTNLLISKRVAALTWLMLVLGLAATIIGLMPDSIKENFVAWGMNQISSSEGGQ